MEDAGLLQANRRHNGAIYLAGYAIECHLKFAYCERKNKHHLPADLEVHDWDRLIVAAGLLAEIKQESAMDAIYSDLADHWGPSLRYRTSNFQFQEANRLYNNMVELYRFLRELVP
jgi:hypothetical protein